LSCVTGSLSRPTRGRRAVAGGMRRRALQAVLLALLAGASPAAASVKFHDGISTGSQPLGIAAGPDGNLWFTEFEGGRVGPITPAGAVTEFTTGAANATGITVGPDGALWFLDFAGRVGRITTTGSVSFLDGAIPAGSEPRGIVTGPDGNLWVTLARPSGIARV